MSKKGISFEEKKVRLLKLFHETGEFFQLKELEKIAPKEKGIVANSVKDVLQSLVDDGAVDTDKISGSTYFWSFPSKMVKSKKRKLEELQNDLESSAKKLKTVEGKLNEREDSKENLAQINEILNEIKILEASKVKLEKELSENSDKFRYDYDQMKSEILPVKDAANRWIDNIFAVQSWCKKKFLIEQSVLNKQFNVPEDLDYLA